MTDDRAEVPVVRLGEVAKIVSGGTPSRTNPAFWGGDIPWVKTANIRNGRIGLADIGERITEAGLRGSSARVVPAGTILMAMYGQGRTRGRVSILDVDAAINQACAAVVLRDGVDRDYVFHMLRHQYAAIRQLSNTGSQENLSADLLRRIPLPIPVAEEQKRIAGILATWDEGIEKTARLTEAKAALRSHLSRHLIHGPASSGRWSSVKLSRICSPVARKNKAGTTHVLTVSAKLGLVDQLEYFKKDVSGADLNDYYLLRCGEFAYNRSTSEGYPFGAVKRLDRYEEGVLSTLNICFELIDDATDSDFLCHVFESGIMNRELGQICQVGSRAHGLLNVTKSDFFGLSIPLPARGEQEQIVGALASADREIALLQGLRDAYDRQAQSLMASMLPVYDSSS